MEKIRTFLNTCLHEFDTPSGRVINGFLSFLILLSITVIPLRFLPSQEWQELIDLFNRFIMTVFTLEYFLRIWSAKKHFQYIFSRSGIFDILAIGPFYLARFNLLPLPPEVFLLFRLFRILRTHHGIEDIRHQKSLNEKESHGTLTLLPNENMEMIVRHHPLIFLRDLVLPLLFTSGGFAALILTDVSNTGIIVSILVFIFASLFFVKAWLDYTYDVIYITDHRVVLQNRELFGVITDDVSYQTIANVVPNTRGFLRWLLKIGDINIETTATMESTLSFTSAPSPHEIVQLITANRRKLHDKQAGASIPK